MPSEIRLHFLGTGTSQGVPVIACPCAVCASEEEKDRRLRCSVHLQTSDLSLVVDAGPDFRQQMLRAKITRVDAIFLTHEHKDHTGGLDDVRALNYVHNAPMDVYAQPRVLESLKQEYAYAFAKHPYPGVPEMELHPLFDHQEILQLKDTTIRLIRGMHYKLPVLGVRIGNLAYLTDMNALEKCEMDKLLGLDVLVVNALRKQKHISHFCLSEALALIEALAPKRAYITHISHQMGLHAQVQQELPENVFLAYDGLIVQSPE